jgi:hypothetical protein
LPATREPRTARRTELLKPLKKWLGIPSLWDHGSEIELLVFDWSSLDAAARKAVVKNQLKLLDAAFRRKGRSDWTESFMPFGLLGRSMPPELTLDLGNSNIMGLLLAEVASRAVFSSQGKTLTPEESTEGDGPLTIEEFARQLFPPYQAKRYRGKIWNFDYKVPKAGE